MLPLQRMSSLILYPLDEPFEQHQPDVCSNSGSGRVDHIGSNSVHAVYDAKSVKRAIG
jgi:hypothetical protein